MATTATDSAISGDSRRDAWWVEPAVSVGVLLLFIAYSTWRAFENNFFSAPEHLAELYRSGGVAHLVSPFYSPHIAIDWKLFGLHISPALLILPVPLSFRLTCYYFRRVYYRSFFLSPPNCAVRGPHDRPNYTGEKAFPLVLQNIHRYTWLLAFAYIFVHAFDFVQSMHYSNGWGVSTGTLMIGFDVALLSMYVFGCHSCRHLVGGGLNCFSCSKFKMARHSLWKKVTMLNERHAFFGWSSLIWVGLTDMYIRLVTSGAITDVVFFRF